MPERSPKSSSKTRKKADRVRERTASHDLSSVPPHKNLRIDKLRIGSDEYVVMSWPRDVESETLGTLTSAERAKLEASLLPARRALTTAGRTAWAEGWALPMEKAIEEAMMIEIASPQS